MISAQFLRQCFFYDPTDDGSLIIFPLTFLTPAWTSGQELFAWGGQSTGVSALASFLPKNTQDWYSEWTGWISLQSKGLSRVFSNTTVQKHQFFGTQPSSQSNSLWPSKRSFTFNVIIDLVGFRLPSYFFPLYLLCFKKILLFHSIICIE